MSEALVEYALRYAAAGCRIIPVQPRGKKPLTEHGAHDACNDEAQVRAWWNQYPDANIGLVLDGLVAVDVDPRNGGDLDALPHPLPDTCIAKTGGGGSHHLFRTSNGARYPGRLAPGVDLKSGPGAYIVVESSIHESGEPYCWLDGSEPWIVQPTEAPAWFAQQSSTATRKGNGDTTITAGDRNNALTSMAGSMRRRGMSQPAIEAALLEENRGKCDPPLPEEEARRIAASIARYAPKLPADLILSKEGVVKACDFNAKILMDAAPQYADLHFDEFLYRMRIDNRDWSDADDRDLLCWLQSAHQVATFRLGQARTAASALACARSKDSLFEFVMTLPSWDGTPRIEMAFIDGWGAPDTALNRAASRNFFIALHARAVKPGAQVDNLWVIEGPQGTLKSASLRELGGAFHAEISAQVGTADFLRELRGIWIAELSELDSLRGREASTVKRLLSAPYDRYVEKYERHAVAYPRRVVAVATTNEATYWQDPTGARRLIPIRAGEIRIDLIHDQRLQWFAEARHLYEAKATWWEWPTGLEAEQDDRQVVDPWEDILRDAMANGRRDDMQTVLWPDGWISSAEVMRDWLRLPTAQQGRASSTRLRHVMRNLGFVPKRGGTKQDRGWVADTSGGISGQVSA